MLHSIIAEDLERIVASLGDDAQKLSGATLLISGGAGFLGSYLCGVIALLNKKAFSRPCRVIALDNYITAPSQNFMGGIYDSNIQLVRGDVRVPLPIEGPVDYIIHAAGVASPVYYQKFPVETMESAFIGAKNLLECAREKRVRGFLLMSSSEIYGDPDTNFIPTPEHYRGNVSSIGPRACYDESKRLAETLAVVYYTEYGVPVKIVRPFNIYGPGMRSDDYRVVPTFIVRALTNGVLPVHDKGNQTRTFCYVQDGITACLKTLLLGKDGEVYNVGIDTGEIDMAALAHAVVRLAGTGASVESVPYPNAYPSDEPRRRCPDISKIRRDVGFTPAVDLEEGLARTIGWFRDTLPPGYTLA
ncbi:MAG: NAD-dependent epimerase/dehydratase family protein [Candidatus Sungiibacteriota bacterium]